MPTAHDSTRSTFATRFGTAMTLIGVAVGLGNVWRFPYMAGKFGGAAFVLIYIAAVLCIGVPGLMAEFALGRETRRGPVGAFAAAGFPGGRIVGWFFFAVVTAATSYYCAVVGWVLYFATAELLSLVGLSVDPSHILPPQAGVNAGSLLRQLVCTALVIGGCAAVLLRGVRAGIERASTIIMPALYAILLVLVARAVTLPGAMEGVRWYILKFQVQSVSASVAVAAIGQAVFSLSLGGTFMVVYGSYLDRGVSLRRNALMTAVGDTAAGLLAGLAIIPAVFALGLEVTSGPGLLFSTLPQVFSQVPAGALFGLLFFCGLFGAAWLSAIAALEVLVAGLTDNTRLSRRRAITTMAAVTWLLSIPPSINLRIFVPWDLTFGSGMQTLGALLAACATGWCLHRSAVLAQLSAHGRCSRALYWWIRLGIPGALLSVGAWWLLENVQS